MIAFSAVMREIRETTVKTPSEWAEFVGVSEARVEQMEALRFEPAAGESLNSVNRYKEQVRVALKMNPATFKQLFEVLLDTWRVKDMPGPKGEAARKGRKLLLDLLKYGAIRNEALVA